MQQSNDKICWTRIYAWYTLDVPISYGPYKFFGLPGLIIKIEESTGMYIWEMYSLSVSATPIHIYQMRKNRNVPKRVQLDNSQNDDNTNDISKFSLIKSVGQTKRRFFWFSCKRRKGNAL